MKKIVGLLIIAFIVSCKSDVPKDYVTFSGTITDMNSDSLFIYQGRTFSKTIKVNDDGTFSDTLKVTSGIYSLYDGNESSRIFLKNGYDLTMALNTKEFDESITFTGFGSESSNYLAKKALMEENLYPPSLFDMEEAVFKSETSKIKSKLVSFLENNKNLDSTLLSNETAGLETFQEDILKSYQGYKEQMKSRVAKFADLVNKPAPKFEGYENVKGGKTSLDDLKGKYVYIDVWATWCGPCKAEIPALKAKEAKYHDSNIEFVSISIDEEKAYDTWRDMVTDKELGGSQLMADNAWQSKFVQDYKINGIPRFILIDPEGKIVSADAPRPSSDKLDETLNALNI